jgi:hypothetical protein
MAITKKGSRRIVVESVPYRWMIRPSPTKMQGIAQSPLSFAVELESGGRTTLVVTVDASRPDNWIGAMSGTVSPAVVESAIRRALHQGWNPTVKGSPYALEVLIPEIVYQLCER